MAAADIVQGVTSIGSGLQRRKAALEQAYAAEYRANIQRIRAKQVGAQGSRQTNQVLDGIRALRAGRGVSMDSPTAQAIERGVRDRGNEAENTAILSQLLGMDAEQNKARGLRDAAPWYAIQGFADGLSSFAKAGDSIASAFAAGSGGGA